MTTQRSAGLSLVAAVLVLGFGGAVPAEEIVTVSIETNFSPNRDGQLPIRDTWVRELDQAADSVRVAMYSFTLQAFKDALIRAQERGLDVRVVGDESGLMRGTAPACIAVDLYNAGIPIKIYLPLVSGRLLHDKFMVIDESVLMTGSANFTNAAVQFNHENMMVIKALGETPQFIAAYRDRFESMWNDEFADFNGSFVNWARREPASNYGQI